MKHRRLQSEGTPAQNTANFISLEAPAGKPTPLFKPLFKVSPLTTFMDPPPPVTPGALPFSAQISMSYI